MRYFLLIFAVVMGKSVLAADKKPLIADPIVEKAIRDPFSLNKPTGELTKADLEKVTGLVLGGTKIMDAGLKEVAKLKQLAKLDLGYTDTTDAGVAQLQKALPEYKIDSNPKKQPLTPSASCPVPQ